MNLNVHNILSISNVQSYPQCYHVTYNLYSNAKKCHNQNYLLISLKKNVGIKIQYDMKNTFFFHYHEDNAMIFPEMLYYTIVMSWYMNIIIIQYRNICHSSKALQSNTLMFRSVLLIMSKHIQDNL